MTTIQTVAFDARYVNDQYHGIGRHAYNLLEALTHLDSNRRYLVYYHPSYRNTRFDMNMLKTRPNVELHPTRLPLYVPSEQFCWPALLAQAHVDLFHSPYVVVPLLTRIKSVMTIHDLILEQYPEYRPRGFLQSFYQPVTQIGVKRASLVLTVSDATSRDIQTYYGMHQSRIRVTGNAVDARFQPERNPIRLAMVRKRYSLPEKFILSIGAGRPHKNIEMLVEAFARLDSTLAPALVIAGELDSRFPDSVNARIHAHNITHRILRPGRIEEEDLPSLYSLADAFVFPSLVEGFGLPPLEAMACGTPVLASTTPAVAEAVGNAACMFDAHDVEQLATRLDRVLTDTATRNKLSNLGLARVQAFTWEQVARKTLRAYNSLEATTKEVLLDDYSNSTRSL